MPKGARCSDRLGPLQWHACSLQTGDQVSVPQSAAEFSGSDLEVGHFTEGAEPTTSNRAVSLYTPPTLTAKSADRMAVATSPITSLLYMACRAESDIHRQNNEHRPVHPAGLRPNVGPTNTTAPPNSGAGTSATPLLVPYGRIPTPTLHPGFHQQVATSQSDLPASAASTAPRRKLIFSPTPSSTQRPGGGEPGRPATIPNSAPTAFPGLTSCCVTSMVRTLSATRSIPAPPMEACTARIALPAVQPRSRGTSPSGLMFR